MNGHFELEKVKSKEGGEFSNYLKKLSYIFVLKINMFD